MLKAMLVQFLSVLAIFFPILSPQQLQAAENFEKEYSVGITSSSNHVFEPSIYCDFDRSF